MKKSVFVALIAVFVLGLAGVALAGIPVAVTNGEFKASYMVWPKIVVSYDTEGYVDQDTIVTIFNDGPGPVVLHCYWMDEFQVWYDFEWEITRFQTVWFKASDGGGMYGTKAVQVSPFHGEYGELKCWAVDDNDFPITKNNFTGTGTIFNFTDGTAIGYNAYGFRRAGTSPGTSQVLTLNGAEYDNCPAYLIGTFMLDGAYFGDDSYAVVAGTTELTLVPCDQDVRQEQLPIYTKANFTVWDEDEVAATGAYLCFKCWVETTLTDPPVISGPKNTLGTAPKFGYKGFKNFTKAVVGGTFATVKITPVAGGTTVCGFPVASPARPFIGLLFGSTDLYGYGDGFTASYASSGSLLQSPSTAWNGAAPVVKYDSSGLVLEKIGR